MKVIGIDYGEKRIGLAISDDSCKIAFPLSVLENNEKLLGRIKKIIGKENVNKIVMGESKNFSGDLNEIMKKIEAFAKDLESETGLTVVLEPEFLTSYQAQRYTGKNSMNDASAAAIILQSYLDRSLE